MGRLPRRSWWVQFSLAPLVEFFPVLVVEFFLVLEVESYLAVLTVVSQPQSQCHRLHHLMR